MALEQDFLPFATGEGANVMDQADYAAAAFVGAGFSAGIAPSTQLNKVWRQSSFVSAAIAQYIQNQLGINVVDDGNLANFIANLASAIQTGAAIKPAAIITASANVNITAANYALGFDREAAPAALNAQLPNNAQVGQEFVIEDLFGNFNAFPVTVLPPAGDSIGHQAGWQCAVDLGSWTFRKYPNNLWSVRRAA